MIGRLSLIVVASVAAVAFVSVVVASASTYATRLVGTVGPGCTMTLKMGREEVLYLKRGSYTITVRDRSKKHGFRLQGPGGWGTTTRITGLSFVGTRTVTVPLMRAGLYVYFSPTSERSRTGRHPCNLHHQFRVE